MSIQAIVANLVRHSESAHMFRSIAIRIGSLCATISAVCLAACGSTVTETVVVEVPVDVPFTVVVEKLVEVPVTVLAESTPKTVEVEIPIVQTVIVEREHRVEVEVTRVIELEVSRVVEREIEVPATVLVERDVIVTVEVPLVQEPSASPPPELEGLCEDMLYLALLEFNWNEFWEVRQRVATSVEDRDLAEGQLRGAEERFDAMRLRREWVCRGELPPSISPTRQPRTPEGWHWCSAYLNHLRNWANPISWDAVTLDEQDAVAAMVTGVLNYCWSGNRTTLENLFEFQPSLLEVLDWIDN